jgi:hypothetical protein
MVFASFFFAVKVIVVVDVPPKFGSLSTVVQVQVYSFLQEVKPRDTRTIDASKSFFMLIVVLGLYSTI